MCACTRHWVAAGFEPNLILEPFMTSQVAPGANSSTSAVQALLDEAPPKMWWRRTLVWAVLAALVFTVAGV